MKSIVNTILNKIAISKISHGLVVKNYAEMKMKNCIYLIVSILLLSGCGTNIKPSKVIEFPKNSEMVIQGAYRVDNYILITSYEPKRKILVYDLDGNYITESTLASQAHLGAISVYGDKIYTPGVARQNPDEWGFSLPDYPEGAKFPQIERFDLSDILQGKQEVRPEVYLNFYDEHEWLFSHASTVENCIFSELDVHDFNGEMSIIACNYNKKDGTHMVVLPIDSVDYSKKINVDNGYMFDSSRVKSYKVPINRIQGVCMLGNGTFLFAQSNGNMKSKLYHGKIDGDSIKILGKVSLPPHAEQVSVYDNKHIMVSFEISDEMVRIYRYKDLKFK